MRKEAYVILIIAVVLIAAFSYHPETKKSIFIETLGDMSLAMYDTGEVAAMQIRDIYGLQDIPLTKGYTAVYTGRNGTMHIRVVELEDHNIANDAFYAMNSKLGMSGEHDEHEFSGDVGQTEAHSGNNDKNVDIEFTKPVKVRMYDLLKPEVYMIKTGNAYNYYYLKMDYKMGRVYWITFDYPDTNYQKAMVRQAIMKI